MAPAVRRQGHSTAPRESWQQQPEQQQQQGWSKRRQQLSWVPTGNGHDHVDGAGPQHRRGSFKSKPLPIGLPTPLPRTFPCTPTKKRNEVDQVSPTASTNSGGSSPGEVTPQALSTPTSSVNGDWVADRLSKQVSPHTSGEAVQELPRAATGRCAELRGEGKIRGRRRGLQKADSKKLHMQDKHKELWREIKKLYPMDCFERTNVVTFHLKRAARPLSYEEGEHLLEVAAQEATKEMFRVKSCPAKLDPIRDNQVCQKCTDRAGKLVSSQQCRHAWSKKGNACNRNNDHCQFCHCGTEDRPVVMECRRHRPRESGGRRDQKNAIAPQYIAWGRRCD